MTVQELIQKLQAMPQDAPVEVNDNRGGVVHEIHSVSHFSFIDEGSVIVLQVNVQ